MTDWSAPTIPNPQRKKLVCESIARYPLIRREYADGHGRQLQQRVKAPDRAELEHLVYTISERTGRYLERLGCWCAIWTTAT